MQGTKKGSVAKWRLVKLVVNFLFYFWMYEAEPLGALLLEPCRVTQEEPRGFSIRILGPPSQAVEDPERKYHFERCSQDKCEQWTEALWRASYKYIQKSLIFYRSEIQKMTGKDLLEQFSISQEMRFQMSSLQRDGQ
ncbi:Pleckstrin homology domain-containing family J member 1 [Sciurus carolinensis]|uniref:Pleckstrin homology domain-containing family J member 1 n=1 Tax=Sciurus carolinensis TaxID=30640 RepID=A0AA41SSZ2_SCICA|nr:Pleckstrin homology domain-containing family J member 1 [Sciurus carolinensis]